MFYQMIQNKCRQWYESGECTVGNIIEYIKKTGQLRDAQIEAIQVYLFLKIACRCQSLEVLFRNGFFNTIDLNTAELSTASREYLSQNPAAAALLEYACLKNDNGEQVSAKLEEQIKKEPQSIDCDRFFRDSFYNVSYTDYLFSLPMGAGKTFLMAAFIYLDLYFALNEPSNPAFAHNFIILAPSGLKSSVVPSLKTIQNFNPAWILPEPAAGDIKRKIIFEVLDQQKSDKKSNRTRNPNAQKIARHQPFSELFGLVAVTNAEKVILDGIKEKNGQIDLFEESEEERERQANELRHLIGKLPSLGIFIDEVHHAVSDEIKLRAVVNKWMENETVNSVIGFSGTPYLEKKEKITVSEKLAVSSQEIANVVYYYPLINGIGNFLKKPVVKISDIADSTLLIEQGVREFFDTYKETVYEGGLTAKLGIYCGSIEKCEEMVYPLVARILAEYGLPASAILKFHKGNKEYAQPADSQLFFETLDKPISPIRVVLLVQIGKEGWDCRSLTGIILSQEGDCPKNMVLQTSCRCLRQVVRDMPETALIYLNESNAQKLNTQLMKQQHISLQEFSTAEYRTVTLKRYDRTAYLKLPRIDYYQLKVNYDTIIIDNAPDTEGEIKAAADTAKTENIVKTTDFTMKIRKTEILSEEKGMMPAAFTPWLYGIVKESFGFMTMEQLKTQKTVLAELFNKITYEKEGARYYSSLYDRKKAEAAIRKAFYEKRDFTTTEELIPDEASLLNIANFTAEVTADRVEDYYPEQQIVKNIIADDEGKLQPDEKTKQMMQLDEETGQTAIVEMLKEQVTSHPQKNRSFHYIPYRTDSRFEQRFLEEVLTLKEIETLGLEVYYNGDRALTEFKIKCYRQNRNKWQYIGMYIPDFLIIRRKEGKIHKIIIAETKGKLYAHDPTFTDKRRFMESQFTGQNNAQYGYNRFEYLYLEDSLPDGERIRLTHKKICEFFGEEA